MLGNDEAPIFNINAHPAKAGLEFPLAPTGDSAMVIWGYGLTGKTSVDGGVS